MSNDFIELLKRSSKVSDSEKWDAEYETLPVVIAESSASLDDALLKLDEVGGYGYVATWRKNLFAFNTKLLSILSGLIDENGSLLIAARVPKN